MLVLADLEQTLIESWDQPVLMPHRAGMVRDFLAAHPDAELGLMSWAVYDDRDMDIFRRQMAPDLEQFLGRSWCRRWTLSLDQWGQELSRATNKFLPRQELFDIFGKAEVFLALGRAHPEWVARQIVLFDDAFGSCQLVVEDRNTTARIVSVLPR